MAVPAELGEADLADAINETLRPIVHEADGWLADYAFGPALDDAQVAKASREPTEGELFDLGVPVRSKRTVAAADGVPPSFAKAVMLLVEARRQIRRRGYLPPAGLDNAIADVRSVAAMTGETTPKSSRRRTRSHAARTSA